MEDLKQVMLIGDSIRIGYEDNVRREMEAYADIISDEDNGGNSRNVRGHIADWVEGRQLDVVHVNAGLHDLRRPFDTGTPVVPLDEYRENVTAISRTVREKTNARLIWATTTPIDEEKHTVCHTEIGDFLRLAADIPLYNEVLLDLSKTLIFEINDLYKVVTDAGLDTVVTPDGAHFTDEGCAMLGKAVAEAVKG